MGSCDEAVARVYTAHRKGLRIGLRARGRSGYPEGCEAAHAVKIKIQLNRKGAF